MVIKDNLSAKPANDLRHEHAPSFIRVLILNFVGLVVLLGVIWIAGMIWQNVASTEEVTRRDLQDTLDRGVERLQILMRAAEMTSESLERAALTPEVTDVTLRSVLERSLSAFEQRPELSYLSIALPEKGVYGNLERTEKGEILLWLFPGTRTQDPFIRNFILTDKGFVPHDEFPSKGYDPRGRPFYQAGLESQTGEVWVPSYQWVVHEGSNKPLWGLSYVKALRDKGGRLIAMLDSDFDLPALNVFLRNLNNSYQAEFNIIELGEMPRLIGGINVEREPLPLSQELGSLVSFSGEQYLDKTMLDGELRWVAARRIVLNGDLSWMVVTSKKVVFINDILRRQLYQVIGMGVTIIVGLLLVSIYLSRRFGKPLIALENRVASIGHKDLEVHQSEYASAVGAFRETRVLGQALDRMAITVGEHIKVKESQAASLALKGAIFDCSYTAIFSLDHQLIVIEWNAAAERMFGLERKFILGKTITDVALFKAGSTDWITIINTTGTGTFEFIGTKGMFDAELRVAAFKQNELEVHTLFINDVSERKRSEKNLQESLDRFYAATRATGDVIWDWNFVENTIWWSDNFQVLFGYVGDPIECSVEFWTNQIHPEDRPNVVDHIQKCISGTGEIWSDEYRFRRKNGSYANLFGRGCILRDDSGRGVRMIGAIQDISQKKETSALIWRQANFDALTGLPNRHMFQKQLENEIKITHRNGKVFALMFLDLDYFKEVNDTLGHAKGDMLLKEAATRLSVCVRETDTVARFGGDEFTIIVSELNDNESLDRLLQNVLQKLSEPFLLDNEVIYITVSIGITVYPNDGVEVEALLKNADQAMYSAKADGRNRYSYFTQSMQELAQSRMKLANDLRGALQDNQLWVAYQPIVDIKSGHIIKAEALIRWQHPSLGLVSPAEFIPVAEHTGLIHEIGEFAFLQSAQQVKLWQETYDSNFQISVNVSPIQFNDKSGKYRSWKQQLAGLGLAGKSVIVEITEGLLLEASKNIQEKLLELRDADIQVALDDFGTGYSSLSYLIKFDIDYIKIDQSFVQNLTPGSESLALCEAMVVMAHKLHMLVVAEGVETIEQKDLLDKIGCDFAQGYLFSKPLTSSEFDRLLHIKNKEE